MMSKQIVFTITRGLRFELPDHSDLSLDDYQQLIKNNGCLDNGESPMSLEVIEAQSVCVHFESQIVEIN